jgi:hypothetical protein
VERPTAKKVECLSDIDILGFLELQEDEDLRMERDNSRGHPLPATEVSRSRDRFIAIHKAYRRAIIVVHEASISECRHDIRDRSKDIEHARQNFFASIYRHQFTP